jgi:hypothetical protein
MSLYNKAHDKLHNVDWNEIFKYDESSPTCLLWKTTHRVGNKGSPTPRKSLIVGGKASDGKLIILYKGNRISIPKIIWVMHNGPIPEDHTIWFKDNDPTNPRIDNLEVKEINQKLKEKYCEDIKKFIAYDESSPSCLRWIGKTSKSSKVMIGDVAGSLDSEDGYWKVHALGSHYKAHRLVWYLHFGKIPDGYHVDHIDRDRQNNKISNLRAVPPSINGKNRSLNSNNKTGVNNIIYAEFFDHRGTLIRRYTVTISYNGNVINRSFSLNKYGDDLAWELALKAKEEIVQDLKERGIGFTEDHGT